MYLEKMGMKADIASNGLEVIKMWEKLPYDIILMDCVMPGMDGFAATQTIRQIEQENSLPRVPIVALTATATEQYRHKCLEVGMDEYLSKPTTTRDIRTTISKFVRTK